MLTYDDIKTMFDDFRLAVGKDIPGNTEVVFVVRLNGVLTYVRPCNGFSYDEIDMPDGARASAVIIE